MTSIVMIPIMNPNPQYISILCELIATDPHHMSDCVQ